ncbi:ferritin-like domain-containing protein [Bhargavaea cecembensis]|uniref:ferritin-like domain-containing protein n=1 Tax=Bhargavaea cecembensis TaxID=394098 RepID=UPI000AC8D023|nr:ferritin-like domain-containing protein [Bhargavaea cecembensis]
MDESSMIRNLEKAIDGEYQAIYCYEYLANQAPDEDIRQRIMEIRSDEMRHYERFWNVYYSLTNKEYEPKLNEKCPSTYSAGVLAAFLDEQKATEFYLRSMREASAAEVRNAFDSAARDEQNHAVWYLYYLMESGQ